MRYKINKTNVVSNALSRFQKNPIIITKNGLEILKILYNQTIEFDDI